MLALRTPVVRSEILSARLLHDILLGTVVINNERRAAALRTYLRPGP